MSAASTTGTALSDVVGHKLERTVRHPGHYYSTWSTYYYCTCTFRANVDSRIPEVTVQDWHDQEVRA